MQQLAALLANLGDTLDPHKLDQLPDAELASTREQIAAASRQAGAGNVNPETAKLIQSAVATVKALDVERENRSALAACARADVDHALGQLDEEAAETRLVAAGGGRADAPHRPVRVPARHQPKPSTSSSESLVLRASGSPDGSGRFDDDEHVARALLASAEQARRSNGVDGELISVATIDWSGAYGGEPTVRSTSSDVDNGAALQRAAREHIERMRAQSQSLVAAGGIPGPPEARYVIPTFGSVARPLRDALPTVLASRGAIVYNMAPTIEDITVDTLLGAIGTVTSSQDLAGATKNVQEISSPSNSTAVVEAETMRFQQGNFADKFYPEWAQAWMRNGQVRLARHNESRRFNDMATASTHFVDTPARLGAWRDLRRCLLGLTEELEDRLRDPNLPIQVLLPEYTCAMLAADLISQAPGDAAWEITEEVVRARLNAMDPNVSVAFVLDGNQTGQRLLTTPAANQRTPGFDADVDFLVFPQGTWAFLDGGSLDLGVVRDSTLNATNKYQTFYETWEAVAKLAPISYRVTISLCSDGTSQAPQNVHVCSPQGS